MTCPRDDESGRGARLGRSARLEEPERLVFTWRVPGLPESAFTEVEVRFVQDVAWTRVELEHRQWERLGALASTLRGVYDSGWPGIIARFEAMAAGKQLPGPPREAGCGATVQAMMGQGAAKH